jgi:hypothetical protein
LDTLGDSTRALLEEASSRAMSNSASCYIFVNEDKDKGGLLSVQFQLPAITMTLAAQDLAFAKKIIAFVAETRGNPAFRDAHIGGGVYRPMPEKSIDISSSFPGSRVSLAKNGEFDSSFILRVEPCSTFSGILDLHDDLLDAVLESLQDIVDDYGDVQSDT